MRILTTIIITILFFVTICLPVSAEEVDIYVPAEYGFTHKYTNYIFTPEVSSSSWYNPSREYLETRELRSIDDMLNSLFELDLSEEDIIKEDVWQDDNTEDTVSYLFSSRKVEKYDTEITMFSRYVDIDGEKQLAYCTVNIKIGEKAHEAERSDVEIEMLDHYLENDSTEPLADFRESHTIGWTIPGYELHRKVNAYYENTNKVLHSTHIISEPEPDLLIFESISYPENAATIDDWFNILKRKVMYRFGYDEYNGYEDYYLNYLELDYELAFPEVEYPISSPQTGFTTIAYAAVAVVSAAAVVAVGKKRR